MTLMREEHPILGEKTNWKDKCKSLKISMKILMSQNNHVIILLLVQLTQTFRFFPRPFQNTSFFCDGSRRKPPVTKQTQNLLHSAVFLELLTLHLQVTYRTPKVRRHIISL